MRFRERATARRQLDKRFSQLPGADAFVRPPRGWIKAIREALGMTTKQLAQRLGVVQSRVVAIEKAETSGSITLDSLERAAQALDCRLVYMLVPRRPLQNLVEQRAKALAKNRLAVVKQIATEHGADLQLETGPQGTTFRLRFCDREAE